MGKGRLIVLEGIDGSGKSSQYKLLCERLKNDGVKFHNIVFPRYNKESSALIRMYLNGEFGSKPDDVNAYAASTFYAVDRFASFKNDWGKIYEDGGVIIADRYTGSNAIHQGCKLPQSELKQFFTWLEDFEFIKMGLPVPDKVVYLNVSVETSLRRMEKRRDTNGSVADIHELDIDYLKRCLVTADAAADFYGWTRIDYMKDGLERELCEKNDEIYDVIRGAI